MAVREQEVPVGESDTHDRKVKTAKTSDEGAAQIFKEHQALNKGYSQKGIEKGQKGGRD